MSSSANWLTFEGIVNEQCKPYVAGDSLDGEKVDKCSYKCTDPSVPYQKYACKYGSVVFPTSPEDI